MGYLASDGSMRPEKGTCLRRLSGNSAGREAHACAPHSFPMGPLQASPALDRQGGRRRRVAGSVRPCAASTDFLERGAIVSQLRWQKVIDEDGAAVSRCHHCV